LRILGKESPATTLPVCICYGQVTLLARIPTPPAPPKSRPRQLQNSPRSARATLRHPAAHTRREDPAPRESASNPPFPCNQFMLSHGPPPHKPNMPTPHTKGKHAPSPFRAASNSRRSHLRQREQMQITFDTPRVLPTLSELRRVDRVRGSTSSSLLTPLERRFTLAAPQICGRGICQPKLSGDSVF